MEVKTRTIVKLVMAVVFVIASLVLASQLKAQTLKYPPVRPALKDLGYGWVIQDLETHAKAGHPMRNPSDVPNWAHELSHQVSSDIRSATVKHDNAFYLLEDKYAIFAEPDVTLRQVAGMVHRIKKTDTYEEYLVSQQRYWNDSPLYILDEANAYNLALLYYAVSGKRDEWFDHRLRKAKEFEYFNKVLLAAVEHYDSDYSDLPALKQYIQWHAERHAMILRMLDDNEDGPVPVPVPLPTPTPYNIRGNK